MKQTFLATGTIWSIKIDFKNSKKNPELIIEILNKSKEKVLEFEKKYSRFKEDSIVSKLNYHKEILNPDSEFLDIIEKVLELQKITNNNFNPWMASELSNLGYGKINIKPKLNLGISKNIQISNQKISIPNDWNLDLGGFAKGYLADKIEKEIITKITKSKIKKDDLEILINAGGDIKVLNNPDKIILQSYGESQQILGKIELKNGSIASSSSSLRNWKDKKGLINHHLISSKTKKPDSQYQTVFVISSEGWIADSLATTLITTEKNEGIKIARKLNLKCLFLTHQGKILASPDFPKIEY